MTTQLEQAWELAKQRFAAVGIDVEEALRQLDRLPVSMHCWQGDDVSGFENPEGSLTGGIQATGNYPGKARNASELRADLEQAMRLIPGPKRLNLHAIYLESDTPVSRDQIKPEHFKNWVEWAKANQLGLDFNPSCFSHPLSADGFTLSHADDSIRQFWIDHCKASRRVSAYFGEQLGTPSVMNIWIPDGMKDITVDRLAPRQRLLAALDDADIAPYHDNFHQQPRYIPLSQPMPLLANTPFIVTGSGKFFRNVQLDPAANLGIVKVDSDGAGYHILWGLTNEAVPTSELPAHFLSHCERIKATNGKDRVIMHCHATNLIALTYVLENDTAVFTRQLWEGSTECLVVFPDGVGILPWMVPGTDEIGQATAQEMQKHSLVLWPFHGVFGSGPTLDETFGLIDTAEKSAQVLVKVYSMGGMKQTISREELIALGKRFGVTPLASALAL